MNRVAGRAILSKASDRAMEFAFEKTRTYAYDRTRRRLVHFAVLRIIVLCFGERKGASKER